MKTAMKIGDAEKLLAERFPEHEFSSGYIGNIERWGDDRSWRLWCRYGGDADKMLVVVVGSTSALPDTYGGWVSFIKRMTRLIDREYLDGLAERLCASQSADKVDIDQLRAVANRLVSGQI